MSCDYKQEAIYNFFFNISKTDCSWTSVSKLYILLHGPTFPWVVSSCQDSSLFLQPPSLSAASSPIPTFTVISAPSFSLVLVPLPHLPASRFSNTSSKTKLLSPLVDCYDERKESRMNGKMIDLPYVGRMQNLDSTGFISRLLRAVCYSNCRLFWLLCRLFTYTVYNSYEFPFYS